MTGGPYFCEGVRTAPCEPDDGGTVQPDGTTTYRCLHCNRSWIE